MSSRCVYLACLLLSSQLAQLSLAQEPTAAISTTDTADLSSQSDTLTNDGTTQSGFFSSGSQWTASSPREMEAGALSSEESTSSVSESAQLTMQTPTASSASGLGSQNGTTLEEPQAYLGSSPQAFTKYDRVIIAHATIGSLVWLLISPAAILATRLSSRPQLRAHAIAQGLVTSILTVVTVILGCIATGLGTSSSHFQTAHQQMGLTLLVLLCVQLLVGRYMSLHIDLDLRYKSVATMIHILLGITLSALGFAQIWLGMDLYQQKSGRHVPVAAKVIWAIIVGTFSVLLVVSSVRSRFTKRDDGVGLKESLKRQKRKVASHIGKGRERGIRSDGLWVGMLDANISGSSCVTSYTNTTMVSSGSMPSPYKWQGDVISYFAPQAQYAGEQELAPIDELTIVGLPKSPPQAYVSQVFSTDSAPRDGLGLPSTNASPLGIIAEEEEEERAAANTGKDLRPLSWASTESDSLREDKTDALTQASSKNSVKRKAVPRF